jgi:hypothetical protein
MKNCIVLSGQYRTFEKTKKNLKHFIDVNEMDVFCHLWSTNHEEYVDIVETLKPKSIIVEDTSKYANEFKLIQERVFAANPKVTTVIDDIAKNASMNYGRKIAFESITGEYETLAYCRYDIGFEYIFKFDNLDRVLTPENESYNLISDIFAIMPFEDASKYFLYDNYEHLHSTQFETNFENWLRVIKGYPENDIKIHKEQRYCPHMTLLRNLHNNDVKYNTTTKLPVFLQR